MGDESSCAIRIDGDGARGRGNTHYRLQFLETVKDVDRTVALIGDDDLSGHWRNADTNWQMSHFDLSLQSVAYRVENPKLTNVLAGHEHSPGAKCDRAWRLSNRQLHGLCQCAGRNRKHGDGAAVLIDDP